MLRIAIPAKQATELWDERTETFIMVPGTKEQVLQLEHSLVSIHKWESKWCKPFLSNQSKSYEETLDYIRCMTITQNVDPEVYNHLSASNIEQVNEYIAAPMTATTFSNSKTGKNNREIVTAEVIYHWMIALQIPHEYRKWHLNQLLTLIRVCNEKNQPPKKRSARDILSQNAALNMARRKQLNSKG